MTTGGDASARIYLEILTKGQDALKSVNQDFDKLTLKTKEATLVMQRQNDVALKQEGNLMRQVPILRQLNPLLGALNLSWIAGAGSLAGLSLVALQSSQTFSAWQADIVNVGSAFNQFTTGPAKDFNDAQKDVSKLADEWDISQRQIAKGLSATLEAARDPGAAMSILNEALGIHRDTGRDLINDVLPKLIGAYTGSYAVYDETGKRIAIGTEALKTLSGQMGTSGTDMIKYRTQVDDSFGKTWNDLWIRAGSVAVTALNDIKAAMLGFQTTAAQTRAETEADLALVLAAQSYQRNIAAAALQFEPGAIDAAAAAAAAAAGAGTPSSPTPPSGYLTTPGTPSSPTPSPTPGPNYGVSFGSVPQFAGGGTVGGPIGMPQLAVVHGGETVSAGGGETTINLIMDGQVLETVLWNRMDKTVRLRGGS